MPENDSISSADSEAPENLEASHPPGEFVVRPSRSPHVRVIRPSSFSLRTVVSGLRTLFQYSDLLYTLSLFRLNVRYKQSVLGWTWAAVQPLALMGIYSFIFTRVTSIRTGGIAYPIFVFSALLPWIFFSSTITNSVQGLVAYPSLLTKMYFPREIIPLSYLTAGFVDFMIASVILAFLMAYYHIRLTWNIIYAVPALMILAGFAGAVALLFSAVHVRFRDVGLAMPFVLQIWMFATPVVYSLESVPPRFQQLIWLDPVAVAIENFRRVVIYGLAPDLRMLVVAAAMTLVALAIAYAYFKSTEAEMADII
jgi:lipopolysaccharide transport system permease protein